MIVVTAPTGNIGRPLLRALAEAGAAVRALARHPDRVDTCGGRVEVVTADLDAPDTLDAALAGAERMFLLSPGPDVPAQDAAGIDAAVRAGVRHLVMVSSLGVDFDGVAGGRPHMPGEARLRESGLDWTLLRPSEFMSNAFNWRPAIEAAGALMLPTGSGRVGFIAPEDIAAVAAAVLTGDGHEGKIYRLTGPAALSSAEVAAALGAALGREVRHLDVPDAAFRDGAAGAGLPAPLIDMLSEYYAAMKAGRVELVTAEVEAITGRPPRSFADWARAHAASLGLGG